MLIWHFPGVVLAHSFIIMIKKKKKLVLLLPRTVQTFDGLNKKCGKYYNIIFQQIPNDKISIQIKYFDSMCSHAIAYDTVYCINTCNIL